MPLLFGLAALVFALYLLGSVLQYIVYILTTFLLLSAAVAVVIGLVEFVSAAFGGFTPYGPAAHLRIGPESRKSGADPAYLSYYAGPVLLDYRKVLKQTYGPMWAKIVDDDPKERADPRQPQSLVGRTWKWAVDSGLHGAIKYPG